MLSGIEYRGPCRYYNFTVYPGNTYDYLPFTANQSAEMYENLYGEGNCISQLETCYKTGDNKICSDGDSYCAENVESLFDNYLNRDEYDFRELVPDPFVRFPPVPLPFLPAVWLPALIDRD